MKRQGFTLIEVLVSATIIAVLVAIGVVSFQSVNKRSRNTKRRADVEQIRSALEMYRADNGYYPSDGSGSWTDATNLETSLVTTYIAQIPSDPTTGVTYRYKGTNPLGAPTRYYGYCVSTKLEGEDPTDSCTPDTINSHTYGVKNP